jgi:hypothetical protein
VARPFALDAATQARIAASSAPPAALVRQLAAEGTVVSLRTVQRVRARAGHSGAPKDLSATLRARQATAASTAAEASAAGALEGDDVVKLTAARDAVEGAMVLWQPELGINPRAVRCYVTLSKALGDLAQRLAALRPPPEPNPDHDPACTKAKARLLALVDEVLAR